MKPFDDMLPDDLLPEELAEQNQEPITLLTQASHQFNARTATTQQEIMQRVGKKLAMQDTSAVSQDTGAVDSSIQRPGQFGEPQTLVRIPTIFQRRTSNSKRVMRLINICAAALLIGLLIGTSIFVFRSRLSESTSQPTDKLNTAHISANGLDMSLSITKGPYFLSELVQVQMTLTNHSQTTYSLYGLPYTSPCGSALYLEQSSGAAPHYTLPLGNVVFHCVNVGTHEFKPGQTITIQQYEPLTSSGRVTLTAKASFIQTGGRLMPLASSPLDGHWPSLQLQVASTIPSDRHFSPHMQGSQIHVDAPTDAHPVYRFTETCDGISFNGIPTWSPVTGNTVKITSYNTGCSAKQHHWQYVVSAPGYAIVAQKYP